MNLKSLIIGFLLAVTFFGCASRKTRDPNRTYLDEIKYTTKDDVAFLGFFTTNPVQNFYAEKSEKPRAIFLSFQGVDVSDVKHPRKMKDPAIQSIDTKNIDSEGTQFGQVWLNLKEDVDFTTRKTEYGVRLDFRKTGKAFEPATTETSPPPSPQSEDLTTAQEAEEMRLEASEEDLAEQKQTEMETGAPHIDDEIFPSTPSAPKDTLETAPQEETLQNKIESIERNTEGELEQIVITANQPFEHQVERKDRMLVLEFKNLGLDASLETQVIDQEESFVKKIAPRTTQAPYPSTVIEISFKEDVAPSFKKEANQLIVEIPKPVLAKILPSQMDEIAFQSYLTSPTTLPGRKISLQTKDTELHHVLKMISQAADYNIIAGREIEGKLTLRLVRVPWDQAFIAILQAYGLGYVKQENILRVSTLKALNQEKQLTYKALKAQEMLHPLNILFLPLHQREASQLTKHLYPFLSTRGSLSVDRPTNTLIIRDTDQALLEVKKFVASLDR